MDDDFMPALNAEEWMEFGHDRRVMQEFAMGKRAWGPRRRFTDEQKMHAVAAMALYGQEFGFTQAEVRAVQEQADFVARRGWRTDAVTVELLRSVARKLVALLPPEEQTRGWPGGV